LRVAAREVVVDGDDVHAAAGEGVEDRSERRHERLAFARPHLGDPALVEHRATDELDVEVAHPEGPFHGFARHREDLGEDIVKRLLEALVLALAARLGQLSATLEVLVMELVIGRWLGTRGGADLLADLGKLVTDLLVGQAFELGLERIGLVDPWLDPSQLTVIRIDETGKETHRTVEYRATRCPPPPRAPASSARRSPSRSP